MKKLIVLMATGVLSVPAIADLAYFQFQGGNLYDENSVALPSGVYPDAALVFLGDLTYLMNGGFYNDKDFPAPYASLDITVGPPFTGGTYSTAIFSENPSSIVAETITLVIDPNGGGLQVGDPIGNGGTAVIQNMEIPGGSPPQIINPGDIYVNIQEVPEPSTVALMGVTGVTMFFLRRKQFR